MSGHSGPDATSYGTIEVHPLVIQHARPRQRRGRGACSCACVCSVSLLILVLIIGILSIWWSLFPSWGGASNPTRNPDFDEQTFAVGFDLSAGYGMSAVSFPNGSTFDLIQVDGTPQYNEVMARLSLESSQHPTPPYYTQNYWADLPRQLRRRLRKALGQPASRDVASLSSILRPLKSHAEERLGSFKYAFVTIPHLPALYNEDLIDACKYLKLQLLTLPWYVFRAGDQAQWPVTHVNTAMAGNGIGLCEDYRNKTHCAEQIHCSGSDNTLSVLYTSQALTVHVSPMCNAMHYYAALGISNFSLGYAVRDNLGNTYWPRIRNALRAGLDAYLDRGHQLGLVVAHGEGITNEPGFMPTLREEVARAQKDGFAPQISARHPKFAAARGAAEFGKRCFWTNLKCIPDISPRGPGW